MRLLIAIYVLLGLFSMLVALSPAGYLAIETWLGRVDVNYRQDVDWENLLPLTLMTFFVGLLPLLTACGLWKRWRLVRLVLIGMSWWILVASTVVLGLTFAIIAGWTDGRSVGIEQSPLFTLSLIVALSGFAAFQLWVLTRRPVLHRKFTDSVEETKV